MTAPTSIPVNADSTYDEPTWAEGQGAIAVPAGEANGLGGVALPSATVNYEWRHISRWLRAMAISRMVPSDAGLFGTFLFPGSGTWTTGGATLNSSLGASWAMIDADDNGGVVIQAHVPVGAPHLFTASRDTYVSLNEAGTVEYVAVANGASVPAATAGYKQVWKVVTNGTEITAATVLITEYPVFKTIGVEDIGAAVLAVSGDADIGGGLDVVGALTVGGNSTLGNAIGDTCAVSGPLSVGGTLGVTGVSTFTGAVVCNGNVTLGNAAGDVITVTGTMTVAQDLTLTSGIIVNGGGALGNAAGDIWTVGGTTTFNAPVTVANGQTFTANGNTVLGNADTDTVTFVAKITSDLEIGIAETTELTINSDTTFTQGFFVGLPNVQATAGKVGYDGSNLIIGNGASVNDIKGVRTDYVVSDDTGSTFDDLTGASVTMTITPDAWIFAKVEAKQLRTDNASTCNLGLAATNGADTITILNNGDADQALSTLPPATAVDQTHPNAIVVRWKPTNDFAVPANNNWTIYARHGVSAGTVTSSNVYLQVWR